jgi:hypothetical protein
MEKTENNTYKVLTVILVLAIAAIIIFVIIPKYWQASPDKSVDEIDFSNSAWIEQYVEDNAGIFGKDFFLNTAFSYNVRSNKMVATYASQESIEDARDYYLALPGAEQTGRNDETSLDVTAENNGQKLRVYNYFSRVSRVFELDLTPDASQAELIKSQLEEAFPAEEVAKISEIEDLVSGEVFGGYVRYQYDDLDDFAYPNIPIFSRAYIYEGTEEAYDGIIDDLQEVYPNNKYDETQNSHYFMIDGQVVSVNLFVTDANEKVVSVSIQEEKNEE